MNNLFKNFKIQPTKLRGENMEIKQKALDGINEITYDTKTWNTDYVCKPSFFIKSKSSDFYLENKDICKFEYQFILETQNEDGSWNVTWDWNNEFEEWTISKNWWKSDIIIKNIKYIKEFGL